LEHDLIPKSEWYSSSNWRSSQVSRG